MKKKKPKTPEQIAQRNSIRNFTNKEKDNGTERKKCGISVINNSGSAIEVGVGVDFACSKRGIVANMIDRQSQTASKAFSKEETIVIEKYKSGEITKEEANAELDKIFKASSASKKVKGKND